MTSPSTIDFALLGNQIAHLSGIEEIMQNFCLIQLYIMYFLWYVSINKACTSQTK